VLACPGLGLVAHEDLRYTEQVLLRVLALCSPSHPSLCEAARQAHANAEAARRHTLETGELIAHPAMFGHPNARATARATLAVSTMLSTADAMELRLMELDAGEVTLILPLILTLPLPLPLKSALCA